MSLSSVSREAKFHLSCHQLLMTVPDWNCQLSVSQSEPSQPILQKTFIYVWLMSLGLNKMVDIFKMTFAIVYSWKKTRQIWGIWKLRPAYSPDTPNLGKNRWCFVPCDLEIDGWPWKTIGHLSFAVSSFAQHFIAIGEFKLELQSGNAQFGSNSMIFRAVWPCNLMCELEQGKSEGFDSCDRPSNLKLDSNRQFFCPCDREIWWMTLQNNRAPLLCYFKLCASFCTHWWIQT